MKSKTSKNRFHRPDVLLTLLWVSIVVVFVLMTTIFVSSRNKALTNVYQRAGSLSHLIATHAGYQFDRADALLVEMLDHVDFADLNTDVSPERRAVIEAVLNTHWKRLPNIASFTLIGADGIRRYGVVNKNFTDLSTRGYFISLRDGGQDLYISQAEEGLASGKKGIHVARRKMTLDGRFAGVVVINLAIHDVFLDFYKELNLEKDYTVAIRDVEKIFVRYPMGENLKLGSVNKIGELLREDPPHGQIEMVSKIDGINRLYAFEKIDNTNLYAVVGLSKEVTLGESNTEGLLMLLAAFLALCGAGLATLKVSKLKKSEARANHAAQHDVLTGLANRSYLINEFEVWRKDLLDHGNSLSVIFLDLDNFKVVNDTLGHATGDELLVQLSKRLNSVIDQRDHLIRLGGDEFIIVHETIGKIARPSTERLCWKLIEALKEPFLLNGQNFVASASIGAALAPEHGTTLDELSSAADIAMYRGKAFGKGVYTIYSEGIEDLVPKVDTLQIEELKAAFENGQFNVFYQPIICLKTGKATGLEVLLRWIKPDGTVVPASAFVEVMERHGLIVDVGAFVIEQASQMLARWKANNPTPLSISINVSPVQLLEGDFVKTVMDTVSKYGHFPSDFKFELSERVILSDDERSTQRIRRLSVAGYEFQLDDFGVGYTSLAYLNKHPISAVKIDRSLSSSTVGVDVQLVSGIIGMAKAMGLRTVVEGIESPTVLELFKASGCDEAQGYLFTAPLVEAAVLEFLMELQ